MALLRVNFIVLGDSSRRSNLYFFLFLIAMEVLNWLISKVVESYMHSEAFSCHIMAQTLSHFLFAHDVIFFGQMVDKNIRNLVRLMRCFDLASRPEINTKTVI